MKIEKLELRKYLLGTLPEESADELDARLFADEDLHRDLQAEQETLIEDFVGGRLKEDENASFSAQIARSTTLQEKVGSFRVLLAALEAQTARDIHPAPSRFSRFALLVSPALAVMLCVAIFLYVRESGKNADLNSQLLALSRAPKPIANSIGGNSVAVAFLSANVTRGQSSPPEFAVPSTASLLELQIEVHQALPEDNVWNAEVRRGSEVVWKSSHVPLHRIGQEEFLSLLIDAADVPPGSYVVQYSSTLKPERVQTRPFRVTAGR